MTDTLIKRLRKVSEVEFLGLFVRQLLGDASAALEAANARIAELEAAAKATVPEGWKLVPVEPTDEMQLAGAESVRFDTTALNKIWTANKAYRAMLATAPAALAQPLEAQADSRYPHAAIGAALISTGLYDRMNDITGGDREARYLIEELISKIDPILDERDKAVLSQKAGEQQ